GGRAGGVSEGRRVLGVQVRGGRVERGAPPRGTRARRARRARPARLRRDGGLPAGGPQGEGGHAVGRLDAGEGGRRHRKGRPGWQARGRGAPRLPNSADPADAGPRAGAPLRRRDAHVAGVPPGGGESTRERGYTAPAFG